MFQQCRLELEAQGIHQWDEIYPNREVIQEDLQHHTIYILKVHGDIAGVVTMDQLEPEPYRSIDWNDANDKYAIIHRLSVRPEHQGKGIALELMEFAHASCIREHYNSIRLDVYSGNDRAVSFYRKLGYELRGQVHFPRRTLPFFCMEKVLT
ncbi:GNAT family N-acetyltransferase [Paenibacillus turpanensis]|uniref:GNAT family N-acetyltransferase n=1 Tax=Paenibacillus turpanensis TaxID=2689078 RepID=UPI00140B3BDB|nr:GNAT family N-acetyltransferase [Paenibacillus turpanensis]